MTKRFYAVWPALGLMVALAGCHAKPPNVAPVRTAPASTPTTVSPRPSVPPAPAPPPPPSPPPAPAPQRALSEEEIFNRKSLAALNAEHPLGDAFFDYDRNELRNDGRVVLERDAQWLRRWASTAVMVQGQCDERGSAEYNLALGDRRAHAVKDYLVSLGIPEARISVVSLGKEQIVCHESNETCWAPNRRGHFVITAK